MTKTNNQPRRPRPLPRGFRNNNPLNIRIGNTWLGEVKNPDDPDFEQFVTIEYGIRAACVLLRRYIRHYHRTTLRAILAAWAPRSENDLDAYVSHITQLTAIDPDKTQILYEDFHTITALLDAMILHENGQRVDFSKIEKAYFMT